MITFKTLAIAGLTSLTLGATLAATMTEANAQAFRGERMQQNYGYSDPGFMSPVATVVGGAIEAPVAIAGAVLGSAATPMAGSNFGYQHWPYGDGYRGGFLNSGSGWYGY
jgi:hypothetical protein